MNFRHTVLSRGWILLLLASRAALGQPAGAPQAVNSPAALPTAPRVTILATGTGALVRSQASDRAALEFGRVSYFRGTSVPGLSIQKRFGSFVLSTRFAIRVDCPGGSASSKVNLTVSRLGAAASHVIAIDGTELGPAAQTLVQSMPCGFGGEHRLDVEIPVSAPEGSIGSTVAFVATLSN